MAQIFCQNCGQELRPTDKFCYNCGAKVQPIKMTESVKKREPEPERVSDRMVRQEAKYSRAPEIAEPEEVKEHPKFHMDESLSWNTDGYPGAHKQRTEETDFSWNGAKRTPAEERMKEREEGREPLIEEQEQRPEESVAPEAEVTVESVPESEIHEEVPEEPAQAASAVTIPTPIVPEEDNDVPTIESITADAEKLEKPQVVGSELDGSVDDPDYAPKVGSDKKVAGSEETRHEESHFTETEEEKQTEKDIFGYTSEDVEAGESPITGGDAGTIDKFYTYSKKNEDFQALFDKESERLRTNRAAGAEQKEQVQEEQKQPEPSEAKQEENIDTGGYVGVEIPEAPEGVDAFDEEEKAPEYSDYANAMSTEEAAKRFGTGKGLESVKVPEQPKDVEPETTEKQTQGEQGTPEVPSEPKAETPETASVQKTETSEAPIESEIEAPETPAIPEVHELPETPIDTKADVPEGPEAPVVSDIPEPQFPEAKEEQTSKGFLGGIFGKGKDTAKSAIEKTENIAGDAVEKAEDAASGIADKASDAVEKAEDIAGGAVERVEGIAGGVTDKASDAVGKAEDIAGEAKDKTIDLAKGAAAVAGGVAAGAAAKASGIFDGAKDKTEEVKETAETTDEDTKDASEPQVEEVKDAAEIKAEEPKVAETKSVETEKPETKPEDGDDHKLTYQDVFSEDQEKAPKHTFLKVIAILILILIILEVVAILIRHFAPDSAAGIQIQQIYEMIFGRFTGQ